MEWAPRMDAVDMGPFYALTVELAGVKTSDIQVEIDDNKYAIFLYEIKLSYY
jgi:HSP20 family molecular chaperone IbpA